PLLSIVQFVNCRWLSLPTLFRSKKSTRPILPARISSRRAGRCAASDSALGVTSIVSCDSATIFLSVARARYGALPSVGLRTTSRSVKPASPSAALSPRPPALSTSTIASQPAPRRTPVKTVHTCETADSPSARKLFGPEYGAVNDACACSITFSWPDSHHRDSSCGSIVTVPSEVGAGTSCAAAPAAQVTSSAQVASVRRATQARRCERPQNEWGAASNIRPLHAGAELRAVELPHFALDVPLVAVHLQESLGVRDRFVHRRRFENRVAADDFFRLGERAVDRGQLAIPDADALTLGRRPQAGGANEDAGARRLVHQLAHVVPQLFAGHLTAAFVDSDQ